MISNLQLTIFIIAFFGFLLINLNCKDNMIDPPVNNKTLDTVKSYTHFLWPSQKGSYWIYDRYSIAGFENHDSDWIYENYSSFNIDVDTITTFPTSYKKEIIDSMYINLGDSVYPSIILNTGYNIPYFIGNDGVYNMGIFEDNGDTLLKKGLYLPKNIFLNEAWNGQLSFRQEGKFQAKNVIDRRCLSFNENIKTPVGNFECYVIKTRIVEAEDYPGYLDFYEYYVPHIGLIAKVRIFILPGHYWVLDYIDILKNYYVNN